MESHISNLKLLFRRAFQASSVALEAAFNYMRQISGDAAYENYLRHVAAGDCPRGHIAAPLSREQFYLDSLRRRYSGVSRCC